MKSSSPQISKKVEASSYIRKAIDVLADASVDEKDAVLAKEAIANLSVIYFDLQN